MLVLLDSGLYDAYGLVVKPVEGRSSKDDYQLVCLVRDGTPDISALKVTPAVTKEKAQSILWAIMNRPMNGGIINATKPIIDNQLKFK